MNFLGIYREPEFSPGRHLSNDAKILRLVGQVLERENALVRLATLEEARSLWKDAELIFSMCQGPQAVAELAEWKAQGAHILNDPEASRLTYRDNLCAAGRQKALGFPKSEMIDTSIHPSELENYHGWFQQGSAWLKRADVHATGPSDVMRLDKWSDLNAALTRFRGRGLKQAVLQEHCQGDEVKFYAVKGNRLFWPYYPKESEGYPFDETALKRLASRAAESLDLTIYGGDAIISPEGKITLIDLNDWPSFAPCRGAAASAIAKALKDAHRALENPRNAEPVK